MATSTSTQQFPITLTCIGSNPMYKPSAAGAFQNLASATGTTGFLPTHSWSYQTTTCVGTTTQVFLNRLTVDYGTSTPLMSLGTTTINASLGSTTLNVSQSLQTLENGFSLPEAIDWQQLVVLQFLIAFLIVGIGIMRSSLFSRISKRKK